MKYISAKAILLFTLMGLSNSALAVTVCSNWGPFGIFRSCSIHSEVGSETPGMTVIIQPCLVQNDSWVVNKSNYNVHIGQMFEGAFYESVIAPGQAYYATQGNACDSYVVSYWDGVSKWQNVEIEGNTIYDIYFADSHFFLVDRAND